MKFNDFATLSDRDYEIMKQNYDKILANETHDLNEIAEKMIDQKSSLQKENIDGKYDEIIDKMQSNIDELLGFINIKKSKINTKNNFNQFPLFKNLNKLQNMDNSNTAISPTRGKNEMQNQEDLANLNSNQEPTSISDTYEFFSSENTENSETNNNINNGNLNNTIPPSDNLSNNSENISNTTPNPVRQNTSKRNSLMQGSFISSLFKQFSINLNKLRSKNAHISSRNNIMQNNSISKQTFPQNRFHNIQTLHKKCEPHNMILGSQIDIVKLLLLYLMLRPNCRYLNRIANIANEQFDIYLMLQHTN